MQQIRALLMLAFHTITKTKPSMQISQGRQHSMQQCNDVAPARSPSLYL